MSNKQFTKTDLNLSAYLMYIGYSLIDIKKNCSRHEFVFELVKDRNLHSDINLYYNGFNGDLYKFTQIQRTLKSRLYNEYESR